jgi:hypothetical protein
MNADWRAEGDRPEALSRFPSDERRATSDAVPVRPRIHASTLTRSHAASRRTLFLVVSPRLPYTIPSATPRTNAKRVGAEADCSNVERRNECDGCRMWRTERKTGRWEVDRGNCRQHLWPRQQLNNSTIQDATPTPLFPLSREETAARCLRRGCVLASLICLVRCLGRDNLSQIALQWHLSAVHRGAVP